MDTTVLEQGRLTGPGGVRQRARLHTLVAGAADRPRWERPALLGLLTATALLYLAGLGASGWANSFYAAAVQAGSVSWKAFFFGSFDASNAITVDKPPASLWVMELSVRAFGLNAWSVLVPQALEGVAAVGLLYATVRRVMSPVAGLIAAAVLAVTPVAVLMFRFDNPDALLVLLLVAAGWAATRALEHGATRWLLLAGAFTGFGFLAKMLQAFIVLPVFAAVYLLAAPVSVRRRIVQLLAAAASVVVSAGWWVAVVAMVPASARPYIGGSQTNSILELVFGYNGLGRLTGNETGSVVPGGQPPAGGAGLWGPTGWTRMFNVAFGGEASWLIPAALIGVAAVLWLRRRAPRTDPVRAAALLWGGWLLVTAAVFSLAQGIIHPYYTVALAPAIGAGVGIGAVEAWRHRDRFGARAALAAGVALSTVWATVLLARTPDWMPWLRPAVMTAGGAVTVALLLPRLGRRLATVAGLAGLCTVLAGPTAYAIDTAVTPHSGAIPSAGPATAAAFGGPGGGGPGGLGGRGRGSGGTAPPAGAPRFGFGGGSGFGPPARGLPGAPAGFGGGGGAPWGGGPGGGLLNASTPSAALVTLLRTGASSFRWVAATVGANSAAGYQLATGDPVLAIGGFNGSDPWPSLATFEQDVSAHRIHWFIAGGMGMGGSATASQISTWVAQHFTATTVGGATVYDLTAPPA